MRCCLWEFAFGSFGSLGWRRSSRGECGLGYGVSNGPNDAVGTSHALILALLAFPVEDMNARDCVITSARREFMSGVLENADVLLIPIQIAQFYQNQFLVAQIFCLFIISRWFAVGCGCYGNNLEILAILCRFEPHHMQWKGSVCGSAQPLSDLLMRKPVLVLGVGQWTTWMTRMKFKTHASRAWESPR